MPGRALARRLAALILAESKPLPWLRVRFAIHEQPLGEGDSRPVKFPPPGPYWVSGYGQGPDNAYYDILIAFVPSLEKLLEYWPDADLDWPGSDVQPRAEITFSDRFPKPSWWAEAAPAL